MATSHLSYVAETWNLKKVKGTERAV